MCEKLAIENLQQYKKSVERLIEDIQDEKKAITRHYDDLCKAQLQEEGARNAFDKLIKIAEVCDETERDNAART